MYIQQYCLRVAYVFINLEGIFVKMVKMAKQYYQQAAHYFQQYCEFPMNFQNIQAKLLINHTRKENKHIFKLIFRLQIQLMNNPHYIYLPAPQCFFIRTEEYLSKYLYLRTSLHPEGSQPPSITPYDIPATQKSIKKNSPSLLSHAALH